MSKQTRIGLLVIAGVALFTVALFAIASREFLFSDTFFIEARYNSVAGLSSGGAVQYQGVNVGRVESVQLPRQPGAKIEVTMAIEEEARHVIRKNTLAQIKTDGLVGNQIVVLVTPAEFGEPIEDGDVVQGVEPFDLFEITDRALESVQNFEKAATSFDQIMQDVRNGEGTLGRIIYDSTLYLSMVQTAEETQTIMQNMADNARVLVELAGEATEGVKSVLDKVEGGEGTIARVISDPQLYNRMLSSADSLDAIARDMRVILDNAETASTWGTVGAFRFAQLMEAAKHNWLFKRYFEERGYMEQAPFEVRERALEETYRDIARRQRELLEWEERLRKREEALSAQADETESQASGSPATGGN